MESRENLRRMSESFPLGTDPQSVHRRIEALEQMLEGMFEVPLIRTRVGLDAIIGLLPVAGDLVAAGMGLYLVWEARNLGLPRWKIWRMLGNVGLDALLGSVPVAGDLFDFLYKSNTRNLKIVRRHLDRHHPGSQLIEG